jgi:hypothetical protein
MCESSLESGTRPGLEFAVTTVSEFETSRNRIVAKEIASSTYPFERRVRR